MCLAALAAKSKPEGKDRHWDILHISDELVELIQFSRLPYSTYQRDNYSSTHQYCLGTFLITCFHK
jgi:hypothetical protein